jgi:hypothetical protein
MAQVVTTLGIAALIVLSSIVMVGDTISDAFDIVLMIVVLFIAFAMIGLLVEYLVKRRNRDR